MHKKAGDKLQRLRGVDMRSFSIVMRDEGCKVGL
jgi:hypothetical protein